MEWIDYRKKLGIGFSDEQKFEYFKTKIYNFLNNGILINNGISVRNGLSSKNEYIAFCNMTATEISFKLLEELYGCDTYEAERFSDIKRIIKTHDHTMEMFLSYYIAFLNTRDNYDYYFDLLKTMLEEAHILFDIFEDDDGVFVFPKGAKELDDALVSQPMEWLNKYPDSRKEFVAALKQYSNATEENASDVADKFRKALERFFQEFFGGQRSLENYKSDFGKYLKDKDIPKELANTFENTLDLYCKYINNYAKHGNGVNINALEFIMYQTGNIIRLLCNIEN